MGTNKEKGNILPYERKKCEKCGNIFLNRIKDEQIWQELAKIFKIKDIVGLHENCELSDIKKSGKELTCPYCGHYSPRSDGNNPEECETSGVSHCTICEDAKTLPSERVESMIMSKLLKMINESNEGLTIFEIQQKLLKDCISPQYVIGKAQMTGGIQRSLILYSGVSPALLICLAEMEKNGFIKYIPAQASEYLRDIRDDKTMWGCKKLPCPDLHEDTTKNVMDYCPLIDYVFLPKIECKTCDEWDKLDETYEGKQQGTWLVSKVISTKIPVCSCCGKVLLKHGKLCDGTVIRVKGNGDEPEEAL